MARILLRYFHTIRHLTLRQLVYRVIRGARPRAQAPKPKADGPSPAGRPAALGLSAWPEPAGKLTGEELALLGYRIPLETLCATGTGRGKAGAARGAEGNAPASSAARELPPDDAFLRYQLSSQLYTSGADTDPEAARQVLVSSARALSGSGPHRPLIADASPHPTSLRLIAWVRLLERGAVSLSEGEHREVLTALGLQLRSLLRRIEYETDGNHLIDNAVGLIYGGAWLAAVDGSAGRRALRRGWSLLRAELPKQLLSDGAHAERSTMYHLLVLERVLDAANLLETDPVRSDPASLRLLRRRAAKMLGWAEELSWSDGTLPALNDAIPGVATGLAGLKAYARRLGVPEHIDTHTDSDVPAGPLPRPRPRPNYRRARSAPGSGYRRLAAGDFELCFDCGAIGPDHVPGHAHADTLQLLLRYRGADLLVDTGTSRYEAGPQRQRERSTAAHNSVCYAGRDQSEVWSSFRVARRARAWEREHADAVSASHDGYARYGVIHSRRVSVEAAGTGPGAAREQQVVIRIHDTLDHPSILGAARSPSRHRPRTGIAYFILSPEHSRELVQAATPQRARYGTWSLTVGRICFRFSKGVRAMPRLEAWRVAQGYRKTVDTVRIAVPFTGSLETHIYET